MGPITQPLRLGNGLVYAFVGNDVVALDGASGNVRWQYQAPPLPIALVGCLCAATTVDFTGKDMYVQGLAAELKALDPVTGEVRWSRRLGQGIVTPTVASGGTVVVGTLEGTDAVLYGLDERTGEVRWRRPVEGRLLPWLARDQAVILAADERRVVAVDASSGLLLWEHLLPKPATLPLMDRVDGMLTVSSEGTVLAIDTVSGREVWRAEVDGWSGQPLVDRDRLFITTLEGQVLALDRWTGTRLWAVRTARHLDSINLAAWDGTLYIPTLDSERYHSIQP